MVNRIKGEDGTISYTDDRGRGHRDDGPAVICPDGREYWYYHGVFSREDGPAVILPDGKVYSFYRGNLLGRKKRVRTKSSNHK